MTSVGGGGDESKGLRRIATGSTIGLAAGIAGLVLPFGLILLVTYAKGSVALSDAELVQVTAILGLAGAILFAVSLLVYRLGFAALRAFDTRFWSASILCLFGTLGVLLIVIAIGLAFASSTTMATCIQGQPTHALTCLQSAAPLASYSGIVGFWLLWLGGLGIVVGIGLAGGRYRQAWFFAGAAFYALLLLDLIVPALGLLYPIDAPAVPLLLAPVFVILAPASTFQGSNRALGRS